MTKCRGMGEIIYRLKVIGLPNHLSSEFSQLIMKWHSCSGENWTIKRLKSLKVDLFRRKSGLSPLTWIRKNRKGDIYGTIGSLFRYSDIGPKQFRRAIQCLMVYTLWVFPSVTEEQKKKFLTAVTSEPTPIPLEIMEGVIRESLNYPYYRRSLGVPESWLTYQGSPSKRAPMVEFKSVPQDSSILDEISNLINPGNISLYKRYGKLFEPLLTGFPGIRSWFSVMQKSMVKPYSGKVAFIQEPGGKLRSVASPFRIFQKVLEPLSSYVYNLVKDIPWDCTFDQTKAFLPVQSCIGSGRTVHSLDLSSFTDYFPLELQQGVLRSFLNEEDHIYCDLWTELCKGEWTLPSQEVVSWKRGQPLGMLPSFAVATLTHGILLKFLLKRPWKGEFYVLGDDVVILDDQLYLDYKKTLEILGCPYSPEKTISSSALAEFAGKIITSDGVIPQMKWRSISDDNFLDLCRALGPRLRSLLRPKQKLVFDQVAHLCEPFGLNMSLPGDNWVKMYKRTLESVFGRKEKLLPPSLMGLRRKMNSILLDDSSSILSNPDQNEINQILLTFDEKVRNVMKNTVFKFFEVFENMIYGFSSLPSALGEPSLPFEVKKPSRVSTLERYLQLL